MSEQVRPGQTPEPMPERIGEFRILKVLGEGSMGRVYLAEQPQPRRQLALKLLRSPFAAGDVLHRFQREIMILAGLEHPGIARLYAAGSADVAGSQVPYLAMEYVSGEDVGEYARKLPLRERVKLVIAIAEALQFAHGRGIVHRDLKPRNILVDANGKPKILDFGLAHAVDPERSTQMTMPGQILGTLPYVAWELMFGQRQMPDARSDVYSLGVIAYEVISGKLPYPYVRKQSLASTLEYLRKATPLKLARAFTEARGDLETVVMKALSRDPGQRYSSATEFARDLGRWLEHRPVEARPPSAGHLLSLFVRRHRGLSIGIGLAALALLVGSIVSLRYALSEAAALGEKAAALSQAEAKNAELTAVNEFVRGMLTSVEPLKAQGREVTVLEVLDAALKKLRSDTAMPVAARATLAKVIGESYRGIGKPEVVMGLLEDAIRWNTEAFGPTSDAALDARVEHCFALEEMGRTREAADCLTPLSAEPSNGSASSELRESYVKARLAATQLQLGATEDSIRLLETLRASPLAAKDKDFREEVMYWQSNALNRAGRTQEALKVTEELYAGFKQSFGPDHPNTLATEGVLADLYLKLGRLPEAIGLLRHKMDTQIRVLGSEHRSSIMARGELARAMAAAGEAQAAEPLAREFLALNTQLYGLDTDHAMTARQTLATVLSALGRDAEVEKIYAEMLPRLEKIYGPAHVQRVVIENHYAQFLLKRGRAAEALRRVQEAWQRSREALGNDHPEIASLRLTEGKCLLALQRPVEAAKALREAHAGLAKRLGPDHTRTREAARLADEAGKAAAPAP